MPQYFSGRLLRILFLGSLLLVGCSSEPNNSWSFHDDYQERPLFTLVGKGNGFTEIPNAIAFSNRISTSAFVTNRHVVNGSGVTISDIDGDELPDVFLAGMEHPSTLHRNLGKWEFKDNTLNANLGIVNPHATGAVFSDIDADQDLDLLVTSLGGGIQLFLNDGTGHFIDFTEESNLPQSGGATSMALADIDGDQDLDLYVGFYKDMTVKDIWPPNEITFERVVEEIADSFAVREFWADDYQLIRQGDRLMRIELAEPDRLFINDGQGYFSEGSFTDGSFLDEDGNPLTEAPRHWTLAVRFQDLNNDGYPDLYVCNDFESPDQLWWGSPQGGFKAASTLALRKTSQSTMSATVADITADGLQDLFLADMLSRDYKDRQRQHFVVPPEVLIMGDIRARPQEMQNMLLLNRGDSTFAEIARISGIDASGWTWSSSFTDVDLDGLPDLLLTTGHAYDAMDADAQIASRSSRRPWSEVLLDFPDLDLPNIAFRNLGNMQFEWVEDGWGLGINPDVAHGMALADLDQDGDQDLIINRLDNSVGVFRNNAEAQRIKIRLLGRTPNLQGIGGSVRVESTGLPLQTQEMIAGGLYLSSSDATLTFAYSEGAEITVQWSDGKVTHIDDVLPNREYWIKQPESAPTPTSSASPQTSVFNQRVTGLHHKESSYPDFNRQPLLPHKLSQRGPALAVVDIDSDGHEDLILGGGKGTRLQVSINDAGRFMSQQYFGSPSLGDHSGIVSTSGKIIAGTGNYERSPQDDGDPSKLILSTIDGAYDSVSIGPQTLGPLALADFTGDGSLEVFVGGHFIPGRYPYPTSSTIFRMKQGQLIQDDQLSVPLEDVGIVSGATAVDLNGDGLTDLALAMMWGAPKIFHNRGNGNLVEMTRSLGLSEYTGWWNGIAPSDFDGDGLMDLVVTNWGQNLLYNQVAPLRAYYGDVDNNGSIEIIEVQTVPKLDVFGFVRNFETLSYALPSLRQRVRSYTEFSNTSFEELFGSILTGIPYHEVTYWKTAIFLNRGSTFEAVPLPIEAQVTPAFAPVPGDFNNDGRIDLFLSQNFFEVPAGSPRLDSGRGLLLLSDESNQLVPVSAMESGIRVYGSQRASVAADFNLDGRLDLAVSQNAGPVVQYENQSSAAGLRVELYTNTPNTHAIGAMIRPEYQDGRLGATTPIVAGSGYWSQNSLFPLIGPRSEISQLHIIWPDGSDTTVVVPFNSQKISVTQQ
ncbi:MAG: FG-GAP-like repeat-containing protein [Bacteroidetes bacterium]|nr:FG-GAP-like repeat-containing protein [Bacteroidota bacterium]